MVSYLEEELRLRDSKATSFDDELSRLRVEHASMHDNNTSNASEVLKLRTKVTSLQKDVDRAQDGLSDRDKCIKERDSEMKDARLKIEQLMSQISKLQQELIGQSSSVDDVEPFKVRINELEAELTKTKSSLNSQSERLRQLEDELTRQGNDADVFKGQLQRFEVEAAHNLAAIKKLLDDTQLKLAAEKAKCSKLSVSFFSFYIIFIVLFCLFVCLFVFKYFFFSLSPICTYIYTYSCAIIYYIKTYNT